MSNELYENAIYKVAVVCVVSFDEAKYMVDSAVQYYKFTPYEIDLSDVANALINVAIENEICRIYGA